MTRDVFSLFKLAKAFDLVFQTAPFTVKPSVDVPSKMSHMEMIRSFHDSSHGAAQHKNLSSDFFQLSMILNKDVL